MKTNRVVVITGAAGGMGSVLVQRFLMNGDTVIATDIKSAPLEELRERHSTDALITTVGDISKEKDCATLAELLRGKTTRVDVLINCAGYYPIRSFEEMSLDEWTKVIDINLTGTFLMTRAMLPLMKGHGWGRVISYGSASVFEGVESQAHYVAAKAGIVGLSRCLAIELGGYGITVNVVTPGLTLTKPVLQAISPELIATQPKLRALKRDEQPEDLVGAVFFLASPDADFITGQIINVDGGKVKH
jgi:NAD(P)-dependent dehydrogenase (short-subunit alcohol dehydrogenase family)